MKMTVGDTEIMGGARELSITFTNISDCSYPVLCASLSERWFFLRQR